MSATARVTILHSDQHVALVIDRELVDRAIGALARHRPEYLNFIQSLPFQDAYPIVSVLNVVLRIDPHDGIPA